MGPNPTCPHLANCPLHDQFKHQGTLAVFKVNYCEGAFETCERYRVRSRGDVPRRELMPNGALLKFTLGA